MYMEVCIYIYTYQMWETIDHLTPTVFPGRSVCLTLSDSVTVRDKNNWRTAFCSEWHERGHDWVTDCSPAVSPQPMKCGPGVPRAPNSCCSNGPSADGTRIPIVTWLLCKNRWGHWIADCVNLCCMSCFSLPVVGGELQGSMQMLLSEQALLLERCTPFRQHRYIPETLLVRSKAGHTSSSLMIAPATSLVLSAQRAEGSLMYLKRFRNVSQVIWD